MKTTSREEALEAALTDERILAAATKEFPRWREDIQEQFVLRVVRAALAALPDERSREFLDWWHERGRYILEASSDECEIVWRAALAQPVQPAPEPTRDFGQFARESVLAWIDLELSAADAHDPDAGILPDRNVGDALRWLRANLYGIKAEPLVQPVGDVRPAPISFSAEDVARRNNLFEPDSGAAQRPAGEDRAAAYDELIYAVANKYPGETRHQTALRYIRRAERDSISATARSDDPKQDKGSTQ